MIAIATGYDALDQKISELFISNGVTDVQIVNYREFLIQQDFSCVIMSNKLVGQIELEYLALSLRERDSRIIYLTNEKDMKDLKVCLDYGVYDLIFDPIVPANVLEVYRKPKTFADVKKIFIIVNRPEGTNKQKDLEMLMKMEESKHVSLVQNSKESYDTNKKAETDNKPANNSSNQENVNNQANAYQGEAVQGIPTMQQQVSQGMPQMPMQPAQSMPQMPAEPTQGMPQMPMQPTQGMPQMPMQPTQGMPQMPMQPAQGMPQMPMQPAQGMPSYGQEEAYSRNQMFDKRPENQSFERPQEEVREREVKPLNQADFPNDKKRVIKETQIESVYQLPHDYKKTIVLLSPESTGKTTMAVNMAWQFNKMGIKTSLIDTDLKKKDVYYNFPIDSAECLSRISNCEDVTKLGIDVDKNLKVFTEHKDVDVKLEIYDFVKLITAVKRISQVVIVDLDYSLGSDVIKNILEIADNILVVVDQKVTTLNRVPEELYTYRNQLATVDLIVNKFYNIRHLEKERVGDFFRGIEIYNGKTFDIRVDKIHVVSDDAKSVLQGLAERTPTVQIRDNLIEKDIKSICESYYAMNNKSKFKMF